VRLQARQGPSYAAQVGGSSVPFRYVPVIAPARRRTWRWHWLQIPTMSLGDSEIMSLAVPT